MKQLKAIIISLALVATTAMPALSQGIGRSLTPDHLKRLVVEAPDSVLSLLDIAEKRRVPSLPQYRIDLLRAMAYNELRMFTLKERYALKVLADDSIEAHPDIRLNAMVMALSAQSFYGDYRRSLPLASEAIRLAHELGNKPGEYNILQTVASDAFSFGDRAHGYAYLDRVISSGSGSDDVRELANVSSALGAKIIQLYADDRYADALDESRHRMDIIDRIDSIGGAPAGFTDQQRAYAYARIASSACKLGDWQRADAAYADFMATDYASTDYGKAFIVDYLLESGRYGSVLEVTRPLYRLLQQADTINDDYWSVLYSNAKAYVGLGDAARGFALMERANAIRDSLMQRERRSHAQELSAIFELDDKELALSEAREAAARHQTVLLVVIAIAVIIAIVAAALVAHYRVVAKRNRITARQIDEQMTQREMLYGAHFDDKDISEADREEFLRMNRRIVAEKLFLEAGCNREMIAERCGLAKGAVTRLIQQFGRCQTGEYINRLKIEYSVSLINEHPDWTIEAIGYASGFNSRSTYYQHFNKVYGITPAQYATQQRNRSGS